MRVDRVETAEHIADITPQPTPNERAAIEAALRQLFVELFGGVNVPVAPAASPRWRYAGRYPRRRRSYGGWA